jgi:hypothetical protein
MKLLEMTSTLLKFDDIDRENLILMVTNLFLVTIGFIVWFFIPDGKNIGMGIVPTALVSLIPTAVFFLAKKLERMRDVEGVLKVALRKESLLNYLKPEIEKENEISLLGSILKKDFFRNPHFIEIVKRKKGEKDFKLRVCVYTPSNQNEYLRISVKDQNSDHISRIIKSTPMQDQKNDEIAKEIEYHTNRMITDINDVLKTIQQMKTDIPELKDKIEIRTTNDNYILDSILIVGDKVVVCDYLHKREDHPFFVLKGGPVSEIYKRDFERVWNLSIISD